MKCEIVTEDKIGFKFSPFSPQKSPDTWSTAFALTILKLLNQLQSYFKSKQDPNVKKKIQNFILNCKIKKDFQHCMDKCEICKKTSEYKTLFSVLEALLILDDRTIDYDQEILASIQKSSELNNPKNLFRLIALKFFGSVENITTSELEYFLQFQRKDGGFNFKSNEGGSINETFWIAYMFENYKFLIDYPRGNLYSWIVQNLKQIDPKNDGKDMLKLMENAKLIIVLSFVWQNLIDELEEIIFSNLSKAPILDINTLSLQGGVKNAEYEIIAFINLKYKLSLDILNNETRINQFISRLSPLEKEFAKIIYILAKQYVRVDLTEIISKYNKSHPKSARIEADFLNKIVIRMIEEHFFTGKITERSRLLKKYYYFDKQQLIPNIITCNRLININDIQIEKKKLNEVREDIYNMTREMKESSNNIMREVESLIFAEEIEYAEKRLKDNIKKALFDAEFFNKNITQSIENFEYIKAREALSDVLKDWESVYGNLRSDFENINYIMLQKIKESEQLQQQKDLLKELEQFINNSIADIGISFDMYKEAMRKRLEKTYSRDNVQKVEEELENLFEKINNYDLKITALSQKINVDDDKVRKKRKKLIDNWISNKQNFDDAYNYYHDGFKTWHQLIQQIDSLYNKFTNEINNLQKNIQDFVADKNFDSAFKNIDEGFNYLYNNLEKEADQIEKTVNSLVKKQKQLYLLYINLESEIETKKTHLEESINSIQTKLKEKVVMDKNQQIKEDFIVLVNKKIDFLNETLDALEKQVNQVILDEKLSISNIYDYIETQFSQMDSYLNQTEHEIKKQLSYCEQNIQNFRLQAESSIRKWDKFSTLYQPKIVETKNRILDDIIKRAITAKIGKVNSNQIDLAQVADDLHINKKIVRTRVETMLNIAKLSGDLLEGTCLFIVHNEDWHINKRLRLSIDGELNLIRDIANRINQLYETSVLNSTFTSNITEFKELSLKFEQQKEQSDIALMQKINYLKPNKNNIAFVENMEYYKNEVKRYSDQISDIMLKAEKSSEFSKYIKDQLETMKTTINVMLHKLDEASEEKKGIAFKKNKIWLNQELLKIDLEIKQMNDQFKSKMDRIWSDIHQSEQIKGELLHNFELSSDQILSEFANAKENLEQKLLNFEYVRIQGDIKKLLGSKQEELNNYLGKLQYEVDNKTEMNEFKGALRKLREKTEYIDEIVKEAEKDLKLKSRKITSNSTVFEVKNKYLLDQWDIFKEEYLNVVQEKHLALELNILEKYIKLVIHIFKDECIPFNYLAREFEIKEEIIRERIVKLIGDKRLPGKIDPDLDIYYEDEKALTRIDKKMIEFNKATKIEKFLMKKKIIRVALQLVPLISGILTITFYSIRLISSVPIPWWSVLMVAVVLISIFVAFWYQNTQKKLNKEIMEENLNKKADLNNKQ